MGSESSYSERDVQEILKLAAQRQESSAMTSDLLRRSAAELGISEEHLAAAEAEYRANVEKFEAMQAFNSERRNSFFVSLVPFLAVNAFLAFLSLRDGKWWFVYVLAFWGLSLLKDATRAFGPHREEEFAKWQADRKQLFSKDYSSLIEEYRVQEDDPDLSRRIEAIKYVREHSGLGLKEAKNVVDHYAPQSSLSK